jgi:hypothetical protein
MKRPPKLVRICVFLVLGAIVNIAVAWGFAIMMPLFMSPGAVSIRLADRHGKGDAWLGVSRPGAFRVISVTEHGEDISDWPIWHNNLGIRLERNGHVGHHLIDLRGWPFLACWCDFRWTVANQAVRPEGGIALKAWDVTGVVYEHFSKPKGLPLRPIWPGFAINTVFYAAILWLLFAAPFALRRWRRIKRGLCPKCAYPVGTSEVCTECGGPVTPR